jgi:hypothetical protein
VDSSSRMAAGLAANCLAFRPRPSDRGPKRIQNFGGPEGIRTPDLLNAMPSVAGPPEPTKVFFEFNLTAITVDASTRVHRSPAYRLSNPRRESGFN